MSISGRKEKEYQGQRPVVGIESSEPPSGSAKGCSPKASSSSRITGPRHSMAASRLSCTLGRELRYFCDRLHLLEAIAELPDLVKPAVRATDRRLLLSTLIDQHSVRASSSLAGTLRTNFHSRHSCVACPGRTFASRGWRIYFHVLGGEIELEVGAALECAEAATWTTNVLVGRTLETAVSGKEAAATLHHAYGAQVHVARVFDWARKWAQAADHASSNSCPRNLTTGSVGCGGLGTTPNNSADASQHLRKPAVMLRGLRNGRRDGRRITWKPRAEQKSR